MILAIVIMNNLLKETVTMSTTKKKNNKAKKMSLNDLIRRNFETSGKTVIHGSNIKGYIHDFTEDMLNDVNGSLKSSKKEISKYTTDDAGNLDFFTDVFGKYVLYNTNRGRYYYWTGRVWLEDTENKIQYLILLSMRKRRDFTKKYLANNPDCFNYSKLNSHIQSCCNQKSLRAIYENTKSTLSCSDEIFDKKTSLLNVLNGTIDLQQGKVLSHNRNDYITKLIPIEYDEKAKSKRFEKFLNDTFGNDELKSYIKRLFGYCITGETKEQVIHFFEGNGANGKSTLLELVRYIMNDYVEIIPSKVLTAVERAGSATPEIAKLPHKRLVCCSELNCTDALNEGKIKIMSSGETLAARNLFSDAFTFTPEFKCIIDTNYLPRIIGTDNGIWRRIRVVPFKYTVSKEKINPSLLQELQQDRKAILAWLIDGAKKYYKHGLDIETCSDVKKATKKYRNEQDTIGSFINSCVEHCKNSIVKARDVYESYKQFCDDNLLIPISETKFGKDFAARGNIQRTRKSNSRMYVDLRLK